MRGRVGAVLVALATAVGVLLPGAAASAATSDGVEHIASYDVALSVQKDGELDVTETIDYDFGSTPDRHGIIRYIPDRYYNAQGHDDRVYRISTPTITTTGDASGHLSTTHQDSDDGSADNVVWRIGDKNETVSGTHTYTLKYVVGGAVQRFSDHAELNWNAIGTGFDVPIDSARVTLQMPVDVTNTACYTGRVGSQLSCASATASGDTATYTASDLSVQEGMTVVAAVPRDALPDTVILQRHFDLGYFLGPHVPSLIGLLVVLLGGGGILFWLYWSRGRDKRYVDQIVGLTPAAGQESAQESRGLFTRPDGAVEFAPPDNIRPGQVGTIIDEEANVIDVTSTIIDFAVRGYLHIKEIEPGGRFQSGDWELSMLKTPGPEFLPYEKALFDALFLGKAATVKMSELKYTFKDDLADVQSRLYDDVVTQGWFARRPDAVRRGWHGLGVLILVLAVIVLFVLYKTRHPLGLIGVGLLVVGGLALLVARHMPAKTGKGSAVFARVLGFRNYIRTAEAEQLKFEEREQIFSRYLPYAMVFGETERWAKAFASIGSRGPDGSAGSGLYWYSGPAAWNLAFFAVSMNSFATTSAGVLSASPPSSSGGGGFGSGFGGGGFSGGGGGGGGGGSW